MKKILFVSCILFSVLSSAKNNIPLDISQKIKTKGLNKNSLGLVIAKIQKDNTVLPLFSLNKDQLFIPASLAKIASLSALYDYYPPSYTFKTSFVSSAPIQEGRLEGDLILKGGGDSSFTSESLWNLVNNLTRSGITTVKGDLLIDDSLYKKELPLPRSERSYLAPSSAGSFNWNSTAFYIRPAETLQEPAVVFVNPENSYIEVINKVKTGKKTYIQIKRRSASAKKEVFKISGQIDIQKKEKVFYRNITHPALWLGYNSLSFLKHRGIKVSGSVKKGRCSGPCPILTEWESRPLPFHSYNLMKYSSNFVSRMLVSHLPLLDGKSRGSLQEGMKKVRHYLKHTEGLQNFRLADPSGFSRKNRFSPNDLQKILIRSKEKPYSAEMLSSYPLAKGKGTLSKRFLGLPPSSFVRAKTGSLYGVLGLAGWTGNYEKEENYVFVFIFNGRPADSPKAQELFDETILSLLK